MNKRQQIKALKKEIARLRASHRFYKTAAFGALYGMESPGRDLKELGRIYMEEHSLTGRIREGAGDTLRGTAGIIADYGKMEAHMMPGLLAATAKAERETT